MQGLINEAEWTRSELNGGVGRVVEEYWMP